MFFRKKSEIGTENGAASSSYFLIPVYRGKTKSVIGDRIVKMVQKSNFCSSNPFIKRLIVKNIQVWCVVFETSGAQSFKIIFASLPYVVNLLSRTNPKLKAFLEDDRVVPYIDFFQEIDFESVLASLCDATLVIQSGIRKCYPVVCVQLGREVLLFSKSSLQYILKLFLEGVLYAVHYIYEDLPHVLQTLCAQNYTVAKYCVQNLPFMALVGAKQFVLFTLFVQRVVTASLKSAKRWARLLCRALIDVSSDMDVSKLCRDVYSLLKRFAKRVMSTSISQKINSSLLQFFNWFLPLLKKSAPLILKESTALLKKVAPLLKELIDHVAAWLPKLYSAVKRNQDIFIHSFCCVTKCLKLLVQKVKPFSSECCEVFVLTIKTLSELTQHYVVPAIRNIYSNYKRFLQDQHLQRHARAIFFKIKEYGPAFHRLTLQVYHTLIKSLKFYFKILERSMSYLLLLIQKIFSHFLRLYQEVSPFLKPMLREAHSVFHNCSKEVATQSASCLQRVVPSLWHGLKIATPVTFHASREIALTIKTSVTTVYPELLNAALVVSPELNRGLIVVLRDSGRAYMEMAHCSYLVSREALQVTKCVSKELPLVLRAVFEVTFTTSGAISEVISRSSKAGVRVFKDVHSAVATVKSTFDSAELELLATVNEIAIDVSSVVSDHKEILEVTILLKKTSSVVITITSKQCYSSLKNVSAFSFSAVNYSVDRIQDVYRLTRYVNLIKLQSEMVGKTLFKFLGFNRSENGSVKNLSETICAFCFDFAIRSMSNTSDALFEVLCAALHNICHATPKIWQLSKDSSTILWFYFCQYAFSLWTFLEQTSAISWQITCEHVPELWNNCKVLSSKTWEVTCDVSPVLWKAAMPVFPVLWSTHCDIVQYAWEINLRTCDKTWKLVVPLSSAGWESAVQTLPKLWLTLCENSKTSWGNLCDSVEFGWNATTKSSALSWHILHKTVSKSWKHAVRPVTISTCYNISSAIAKSIKMSYNVCAETKKLTCYL